MGNSRKAEPAVLSRDDHPEEAFLFEIIPYLVRDGAVLPDLPVVEPPAQLLDRTVEERLLRLAQAAWLEREELLPIGIAGEQLAIPPHRPGLERDALRLAHARQQAGERRHQPL
jgi:hypothetical protein